MVIEFRNQALKLLDRIEEMLKSEEIYDKQILSEACILINDGVIALNVSSDYKCAVSNFAKACALVGVALGMVSKK